MRREKLVSNFSSSGEYFCFHFLTFLRPPFPNLLRSQCDPCRSKGFDCGNCRRRGLYGYTGYAGQGYGGYGYRAHAGKGVSFITNNAENGAMNTVNANEGSVATTIENNENGAMNTVNANEGSVATTIENNENGAMNTMNANEGSVATTIENAENGNYRSLQEETVSLDWVAVALQYFNCSEGCLINFYDTNECSDEALRPLSPMAGISLTYSIDGSGKTLGNATIPGPIEQYLDKVRIMIT